MCGEAQELINRTVIGQNQSLICERGRNEATSLFPFISNDLTISVLSMGQESGGQAWRTDEKEERKDEWRIGF